METKDLEQRWVGQYAVVELNGHITFGAKVTDCKMLDRTALRIEVINRRGEVIEVQQVYASSLYRITEVSKERAIKESTFSNLHRGLKTISDRRELLQHYYDEDEHSNAAYQPTDHTQHTRDGFLIPTIPENDWQRTKIYVATSWRNEIQPEVVNKLRGAGFHVYDFRHPHPTDPGFSWREIDPDFSKWTAEQYRTNLKHVAAIRGYNHDITALDNCDICVFVQPCGRSASLELGYAAGKGKRTFVVLAEGQEPELMLKAADEMVLSMDELLNRLGSKRRVPRWDDNDDTTSRDIPF